VQRDHHAPGDKQANADGLNHAMSLARDANLFTDRQPIAEPWPTPRVANREGSANRVAQGGPNPSVESASQDFGGTGGFLWPVTNSEPGRVARLKAIGNAVVPAWVLAGPFQYILDREGLRDNKPLV